MYITECCWVFLTVCSRHSCLWCTCVIHWVRGEHSFIVSQGLGRCCVKCRNFFIPLLVCSAWSPVAFSCLFSNKLWHITCSVCLVSAKNVGVHVEVSEQANVWNVCVKYLLYLYCLIKCIFKTGVVRSVNTFFKCMECSHGVSICWSNHWLIFCDFSRH